MKHLIRVVFSQSRRGYSDLVFTQSNDKFIRCIENVFELFVSVPQTLVVDNPKGAVLQPGWFDPEINPNFANFCRLYATVALPTKPRTLPQSDKPERGNSLCSG